MRTLFCLMLISIIGCTPKNESIENKFNSKIVAIQPYENISKNECELIAKTIDSFYHFKSKILPLKQHTKQTFVNVKKPRHRADSIIRIQNRNIPSNVNYILGLTTVDISTTKHDKYGNIAKPVWKYNDFGVMGLAYRPGKSAIISNFRIKHKNKKIAFTRFKKVVIHELGHNLGLSHCPNEKCVMTAAKEKISTIDNEKLALCNACENFIRKI